MFLFFDTETTGLPKNWNAPLTDLDNWPRLVQLACILTDGDGKVLEQLNRIVVPVGFTIPEEASRIHGITHQKAIEQGSPIDAALEEFLFLVSKSQFLVAHNMDYDKAVMGAELLRSGRDNVLVARELLCTMKSTIEFCDISGYRGPKFPKLAELHHKLFGRGFEGAHDAKNDISATAKCFFELRNKGIMFHDLKIAVNVVGK